MRIVCVVLGILAAAAAATAAPPLRQFTIPWGEGPKELGLVAGAEVESAGPLTFAVSPAGTLYVADTIQGSVKEFDPDGTYLRTVTTPSRATAMTFAPNGEVYLLEPGQVRHVAASGTAGPVWPLPAEWGLVEGYAQEIFFEQGRLAVNDPDERIFYVTDPTAIPAEGRLDARGERIKTARGAEGRPRIEATDASKRSRVLLDPPASAPDGAPGRTGGLIYRGTDRDGQTIVEQEVIDADSVALYVHRGTGRKPLELNNDYLTTVYKKFEVTAAGVWQMRTTAAGAEFTLWGDRP